MNRKLTTEEIIDEAAQILSKYAPKELLIEVFNKAVNSALEEQRKVIREEIVFVRQSRKPNRDGEIEVKVCDEILVKVDPVWCKYQGILFIN